MALHEARREHEEIVQVAGRKPRVVRQNDVAGLDGPQRNHLEHPPRRGGDGVEVARGPGPLGHQLDDLVAQATRRPWSSTQLLEHLVEVEQQERARRASSVG
jgi:hypothetical protein